MTMNKNLKIVFFGTPEFAVTSLDALLKAGFNVCSVVTMPDKIAGRGHKIIQSDVKRYAVEHNLPVMQPEKLKSPEFVEALRALNADLFIVIAFRMLPEIVWQMPRLGTFNLHASLLPKYRGAAPINHAVMNGETETGITTFFLKHEIDTGDMIMQRSITIGDDETVGSVHDRLMLLGAEAVVTTVNDIISGTLHSQPQPEGDFIPAPKIFKDTCRIDWNKSAREIHNHVRGLSPYPAAWTRMITAEGNETDIKIFTTSTKDIPQLPILSPGLTYIEKGHLYAGTSTHPIEIRELQPAGKKRMEASAFILGYHPAKLV